MKLTDKQNIMIKTLLKETFYYVGFQDPVQVYFWRDRNGEMHNMNRMGLDYLHGAIEKIKFDLKNYNPPTTDTKEQKVLEDIIITPAKEKLCELQLVFKRKSPLHGSASLS